MLIFILAVYGFRERRSISSVNNILTSCQDAFKDGEPLFQEHPRRKRVAMAVASYRFSTLLHR
jgi:hypothetical protein